MSPRGLQGVLSRGNRGAKDPETRHFYWVQGTSHAPVGQHVAARSDGELVLRKLDTLRGRAEGRDRVGCLSQGTGEAGGAGWKGGSRSGWGPGPRRTQGVEGEGIRKLHRGPQAPKTKITELGVREGSRQEGLPLCTAGGSSLPGPTCKGSVHGRDGAETVDLEIRAQQQHLREPGTPARRTLVTPKRK